MRKSARRLRRSCCRRPWGCRCQLGRSRTVGASTRGIQATNEHRRVGGAATHAVRAPICGRTEGRALRTGQWAHLPMCPHGQAAAHERAIRGARVRSASVPSCRRRVLFTAKRRRRSDKRRIDEGRA
eukprot:355191-Chlamydomonas_euryale.AAC.2